MAVCDLLYACTLIVPLRPLKNAPFCSITAFPPGGISALLRVDLESRGSGKPFLKGLSILIAEVSADQ